MDQTLTQILAEWANLMIENQQLKARLSELENAKKQDQPNPNNK